MSTEGHRKRKRRKARRIKRHEEKILPMRHFLSTSVKECRLIYEHPAESYIPKDFDDEE